MSHCEWAVCGYEGFFGVGFIAVCRYSSVYNLINLYAQYILYIGQTCRYSPEYSFCIFSQQIYLNFFFGLSLAIFVYSHTKCLVFPNVTLFSS